MFGLSTPMVSQLLNCLNPIVVLSPLWVFLSCTPLSTTRKSPYFFFYHLGAIIFFCSLSVHSWMSARQSQRDLTYPGALCFPCSRFHCRSHVELKSFPRNLACQPALSPSFSPFMKPSLCGPRSGVHVHISREHQVDGAARP